jgi:drug/metabolite transporter (DMT)-like permease
MILWGLSWPTAKIVTGYGLNSNTLLFWRFFLTSLGFIPIAFFYKIKLKINKRDILHVIIGGLTLYLYNELFFLGLKHGLSGKGGVLVTTLNPILTFLVIWLITRKPINLKEKFGLFLGFIGGLIILQVWELKLSVIFSLGNIYFLLAALAWVFVTISSSQTKGKIDSLTYSFYAYIFTTIFSLFTLNFSQISHSFDLGFIFWINMFFISIVVTSVATTIYFKTTTILGSSKSSSFIFLVPVSALFGSYIILGEIPKNSTILGGLICLIAVYLINKKAN